MSANGELERPADPAPGRELRLRVISAVVLAAAALAVTAAGGAPFMLFWTAAALWVFWEWIGIVEVEARYVATAIGAIAIVAMAFALAFDAAALALIITVIASGIVMAVAYPRRVWAGGGVIYAAALLIPCVMLRDDPRFGLVAIFWLFAVVWAADTGAYFAGRLIGGRRLAPRLSPNKTWSGAAGGAIAGIAAGFAVLAVAGIGWHPMHLSVALLVVIAAQLGDLFESGIKRYFGIKDASELIPGHGGLMDRVDGFIAAAVVALVIGMTRGGASAPATGLLAW